MTGGAGSAMWSGVPETLCQILAEEKECLYSAHVLRVSGIAKADLVMRGSGGGRSGLSRCMRRSPGWLPDGTKLMGKPGGRLPPHCDGRDQPYMTSDFPNLPWRSTP